MEKIKTDVLILGAGWSGLVAADLLSQKKKETVILEKEPQAGGLARTLDFNGFKFDLGGHGLFFKDPENISYLKNILNQNGLAILKRKIKVLFNNKYIDYPPSISSVIKLNKKYILNISRDMFRLKNKRRAGDFEEWVMSNYGECLYSIYFKDYTEKVWGVPCSQLSASWADKRIGNNNLMKLFKGLFISNGYCKENRQFFYYPGEGIGAIPSSLEHKVNGNNCKIFKNVRLKEFVLTDGKTNSLFFALDSKDYEISFNRIISSIPIVELIRVFPDKEIRPIQNVLQGIKYRNLIIVNLVIDKKIATNWYWCYFPSKEVIFSRIHEPKFWSADMAPKDKTALCIEIFCDHDDKYWNTNDEELIRQVKNCLRYIGLFDREEVFLDACVKRVEYAYPLHYKGFEDALNKINDFLAPYNNLLLIGRNGTHSYFDMEECLNNVKEKIGPLDMQGD